MNNIQYFVAKCLTCGYNSKLYTNRNSANSMRYKHKQNKSNHDVKVIMLKVHEGIIQ